MSTKIDVNIHIDKTIQSKSKPILNKLDLSLSEAVELFLTQIVSQNQLPFDLRSARFRHIANDEVYERVNVFHHEMLFTPSRIERKSLPNHIYLYEVQYDDDNIGNPDIIKEHILCNFFGTLLSKSKLEITDGGLPVNDDTDWVYFEGDYLSLEEWTAE